MHIVIAETMEVKTRTGGGSDGAGMSAGKGNEGIKEILAEKLLMVRTRGNYTLRRPDSDRFFYRNG